MKRLIISTSCALFVTMSVLSAMQVSAEVKTKAAAVVQTGVAGTQVTSARDSSNLRCWQYGELLFEETHLSDRKLSSQNSVLVFEDDGKSGEANDRELYLIDTGSATCLYEKI